MDRRLDSASASASPLFGLAQHEESLDHRADKHPAVHDSRSALDAPNHKHPAIAFDGLRKDNDSHNHTPRSTSNNLGHLLQPRPLQDGGCLGPIFASASASASVEEERFESSAPASQRQLGSEACTLCAQHLDPVSGCNINEKSFEAPIATEASPLRAQHLDPANGCGVESNQLGTEIEGAVARGCSTQCVHQAPTPKVEPEFTTRQGQHLPPRHVESTTSRSSSELKRVKSNSNFTQYFYDYLATDLIDFDFEDLANIQEEDPIPDIEDLRGQAELYEAVRRTMARRNAKMSQSKTSTSALTSKELRDLLSRTVVRLRNNLQQGDYDRYLSKDEQAGPDVILTAVQCVKDRCDVDFGLLNLTDTASKLVNPGIYLYLSIGAMDKFTRSIQQVKDSYRHHEASFRSNFWERLVFRSQEDFSVVESEGRVVTRLVELPTKTVSVCTMSEAREQKKKNRARPTELFSEGVFTYYPFRFMEPAESSLPPVRIPDFKIKRANGYIYFDIAYALEAHDILQNYNNRLDHLFRIPVNRLFIKTDSKNIRCSPFTYLPHLLIEVKPLPDGSQNLMRQAVGYLVLNSSALLHDYMKLLWLGAPVGSKFFKADTPCIYLAAAVGFTVALYCAHIRKFSDWKPAPLSAHSSESNTNSIGGNPLPLVRYEVVHMGTYNLEDTTDLTEFVAKYNTIQSAAHLHAHRHKCAMERAMESIRDIAKTELRDLSFTQHLEDGEVVYAMVDSNNVFLYERDSAGADDGQDRIEQLSPKVVYNESVCGELPKPDDEEWTCEGKMCEEEKCKIEEACTEVEAPLDEDKPGAERACVVEESYDAQQPKNADDAAVSNTKPQQTEALTPLQESTQQSPQPLTKQKRKRKRKRKRQVPQTSSNQELTQLKPPDQQPEAQRSTPQQTQLQPPRKKPKSRLQAPANADQELPRRRLA